MLNSENINYILGLVAIVSIIFSIYNYFKNPQEDQEKKLALAGKDIDGKATILAQKEMENKANLLAEQVKWTSGENEKKFAEMGIRIDRAFEVAQNHINTIETEVKSQTVSINVLTNKMTELTAILNERLPKRTI